MLVVDQFESTMRYRTASGSDRIKHSLFVVSDIFLGPKGRDLVATSVRAWTRTSKRDERRRCGTSVWSKASVGPLGLKKYCVSFHALTDVATKSRPFGPKIMLL